jgi:excinuclease ABC subunit A
VSELERLDPRKYIIVKGARIHNLKRVSVAIPRNKFTVITGVSGSGKSSLAFDTLYAEGQRRYVESLSSYARQFLGRLDKPPVDWIRGISPAVAIEQKVISRNPRSTVGTTTEIYDYLKLLFARIGRTYSPVSGKEVKRETPEDLLEYILEQDEGSRFLVTCAVTRKDDRSEKKHLEILLQQGFSKLWTSEGAVEIEDAIESGQSLKDVHLIIDRLMVEHDGDNESRILDSAESAFFEGDGYCDIIFPDNEKANRSFSNKFEMDGIKFEEPVPDFFSFNNPLGACKKCEGFGSVIGIDPKLVIPNPNKSVYEDAVVCWVGEKMSKYKQNLIIGAEKTGFPVHKPISELSEEHLDQLWNGTKHFKGINDFFKYLESKLYKIQYRVMLSRYRGKTKCPECQGSRIRHDSEYVKVDGRTMRELISMPVDECLKAMQGLTLSEHDQTIAKQLLAEVHSRLQYLCDVGLGYLTLSRLSNSLSGGESQRINLASSLGSSLVGSMYILDEPSIGLHSRDTERLISVLKSLRDLGNSVIVVEHDEEVMNSADRLIDLGPGAGSFGGELIFEGTHDELIDAGQSLTADYLTGRKQIVRPGNIRKWNDSIAVTGARENNLKGIDVEFPLRVLTAITGVSGSGKSSLVRDILYPSIRRHLGEFSDRLGDFNEVSGDLDSIQQVEFVDQNPIGKSSRSNPVTYIKAYDEIRALFAATDLAKSRGYKPSHFSFNVAGGRCDNCEGEGMVTIEMQFMADIKLKCDHCDGKRFKEEIIDIKYNDKSIADILEMTIDEAISFFEESTETAAKRLVKKLLPLQEVGLGYVGVGQASSTLSGGEAQRVKLAYYLSQGGRGGHTVFIFDEPTTGLHFDDVRKLLDSFNALIALGHSVIVIEHNLDVVACSDWVIDLGPEGGKQGGSLVFAGTPEQLTKIEASHTGRYLGKRVSNLVS